MAALTTTIALFALSAGCDGEAEAPRVRLLVPGDARLAGFGDGACSAGQTGPRYCAFYRPGPGDSDRTELWVLDVSAALAGASTPCDGTSPRCVRLAERLFTGNRIGSPSHPEAHRFEGDTLLFLADERPAAEPPDHYEGYVWAWRPGWSQPRRLTSDRGVLCHASAAAPVAYCVDGVVAEPRLRFDLRAGVLRDAEDSQLPVVETIHPLRGQRVVWSADFSPAGDLFVYSSLREGEAAETLRVVPTAELGRTQPRAVLEDGNEWTLSPDGQAIYFLRGPTGRDPALWGADFPSGAGAVELATGVADFTPLRGPGGVAFVTDQRGFEGILHVLRDRKQPQQRATVSRDVHFWMPAADGRFAYVLQVNREGERGMVAQLETGALCRLGSRPDVTVYGAQFLARLGLVAWSEQDPADPERELTFLGDPTTCGGVRPLGTDVGLLYPLGARGLLLGRQRGEDTLALFHAPALDGRPLEEQAAPLLPAAANEPFAPVGPGPDALLLPGSAAAPAGRGLYLFGPLR